MTTKTKVSRVLNNNNIEEISTYECIYAIHKKWNVWQNKFPKLSEPIKHALMNGIHMTFAFIYNIIS